MIEKFVSLSDEKIFYVLGVLAIAMVIDSSTGIIAAKMRREFTSKIGINGIIRKIWSLLLLIFFLPVSILIPLNLGTGILYFFYLSYLFMEIHSILENYEKMGIDNTIFQNFLNELIELLKKKVIG